MAISSCTILDVHGKPLVLLAEDEANDRYMVERAMRKHSIDIDLRMVSDGEEAVQYLSAKGEFSDRKLNPLPRLIVLDIKMPRRSGLEVLEWIRQDAVCKLIPVVIMSSSELPADVNRAYGLGVNAYLVKPAAFTGLVELFNSATDLFIHKAAHPQPA
ncbi:MAG: response regulator [Verrucomicrobiales bacterium]|nr:response regulator [Verrucomicrobiales bacterium]